MSTTNQRAGVLNRPTSERVIPTETVVPSEDVLPGDGEEFLADEEVKPGEGEKVIAREYDKSTEATTERPRRRRENPDNG